MPKSLVTYICKSELFLAFHLNFCSDRVPVVLVIQEISEKLIHFWIPARNVAQLQKLVTRLNFDVGTTSKIVSKVSRARRKTFYWLFLKEKIYHSINRIVF